MNLSKTLLRRKVLLVTFAGFALSLALILHFISRSPIQQSASALPIKNTFIPLPKQELARSAFPLRLKIPKINVDAALDYVGITPQGELGVPKGPANAAWYDLGPRPGERGSSVIDGHYGWKDGIPAVFDNLHKLQQGDKIYVKGERGATTTFVVRELRTYGPNEDDSNVFVSSDEKAHLNLITCQGVWNETQKSYSNRLAVFADKV